MGNIAASAAITDRSAAADLCFTDRRVPQTVQVTDFMHAIVRRRSVRPRRQRRGPLERRIEEDVGSSSSPVTSSKSRLVEASTRLELGWRQKADRRPPVVIARQRGREPAELIANRSRRDSFPGLNARPTASEQGIGADARDRRGR